MIIAEFIYTFLIEVIFFGVLGFIGHSFVRAITRNRVQLEWGSDSGTEGIMAVCVGTLVLMAGLFIAYRFLI